MKYKIQKYGNQITATPEGVEIVFKNKKKTEIGEIDIDQGLDKVEIKVVGKKIVVKSKVL